MPQDERGAPSDHDLLIRLHERMVSLEKHILESLERAHKSIGKIGGDIEKKLDIHIYKEEKKEIDGKIEDHEKRIGGIEKYNLISETKKAVYFDIASFTWKHWLQLGTFLTFIFAVIKALFYS